MASGAGAGGLKDFALTWKDEVIKGMSHAKDPGQRTAA